MCKAWFTHGLKSKWNANADASEFTSPMQTQGKRHTPQAQWKSISNISDQTKLLSQTFIGAIRFIVRFCLQSSEGKCMLKLLLNSSRANLLLHRCICCLCLHSFVKYTVL